jgi:negative elongation factor B
MDGLQEIGIAGREYLKEALTNCSDPLKAIEEFQSENGILLPSLRTMLPLLDLHGLKRFHFHSSVSDDLREKLLERIDSLQTHDPINKERILRELLDKSFPVIRIPKLQPVVLALLKNLDQVDDKYLKQLVADKQLYDKLDVSVKRQIWQQHQGLFGDEVSPLFSQYIKDKEKILHSYEQLTSFFVLSPRQRRQNEVIQSLVKMIGKNVLLYDTCLQFLRTLYLRTKNSHYCTLRVELLMALHDAEVQEITAMDPCHKFAWCLDACIREQNIDLKRSRELQGLLEGVRKEHEQVIGDLSMTLCDPYAINFLTQSALKIVNHLISGEHLPRENPILLLILRMLNLGLHCWDIFNSQVFREPHLDPTLVTKFVPVLMTLIVDDQVRAVNSKLPPDDRESALAIIEHSGPPPDLVQKFVQDDRLATLLTLYYAIQLTRQKDKCGLVRILGSLAASQDTRLIEDPFLHTLVLHLVPMTDEFGNEELCTAVFDELLLSIVTQGNAVHHLLKLVYHVCGSLPEHRLELLLKTVCSYQIRDHSKELLEKLQNKVQELKQQHEQKRKQLHAEPDEIDFIPAPAN